MDPVFKPVDTFATTFSADQFADQLTSPSQDQAFLDVSPIARNDSISSQSPHSAQRPGSGSPTQTTSAPPNSAGLNPRSCVTCRRRKVKCDKKQPCSNCNKASIECVFPRPGRAPRKSKKPPDAELLARLRRLEGVVQKLGKGADGEDLLQGLRSADEPVATIENSPGHGRQSPKLDKPPDTATSGSPHGCPKGMLKNHPHGHGHGLSHGPHSVPGNIDKEIGRLVIGDGKSIYVSNGFWASLTTEISSMKDILVEYSSDEEEGADDDSGSPESSGHGSQTSRITHQEFIFGYSSNMMTLRILHPPADQIMKYWSIYKTNVDPVLRILHKPTSEKLFEQASRDQSSLTKSEEAMTFAVYFAVFTALSPEECRSRLMLDKDTGIKRFRYATEQALARAGFLSTQELLLVQAFVLYLCCVRRHDDVKPVWTLTGVLVRMAHSLGIHRDGEKFGLSPYDTEMRRRLWWQVCTLDVRASEDQGADPLMAERWFDTKMPLNINDTDIWPDMVDPPAVRDGCTEMTFDLVRYEIGSTIQKLAKMQKCPNPSKWPSLAIKESVLEGLRMRLEDKYLRHCNMNDPLQWVAANVSRLVMAKIWLVIHHPMRGGGPEEPVSPEIRDRIFLTSIDVIRFSRLIETQQKSMKWGWLFKSYFQWHAIAFLLTELCKRTEGPAVEDAWAILDEGFPEWERDPSHKKSVLWKPVVRLLVKARDIRAKALEQRRLFPTDGTLGPISPGSSSSKTEVFPIPNTNIASFNDFSVPFGAPLTQTRTAEMADVTLPADEQLLDMDSMGAWLNDPAFEQDPFQAENLTWGNWGADMTKEFQEGGTPLPMEFSMGAMWGGG